MNPRSQLAQPRLRLGGIVAAIALTVGIPSPAAAAEAPSSVSVVAGTGTRGWSGDGGAATAAELKRPGQTAVAPDGRIYIVDHDGYKIRLIEDGIITTVVGRTHTTSANEPAVSANVSIAAIEVGPDGLLYFTDPANSAVWYVDNGGILRPFAGTGASGFSGDGGPALAAQLSVPFGLAFAPDGSMYISDTANNRIRRVDTDGNIHTVAGVAPGGFGGDGGPASAASLLQPTEIAIDWYGNVYFQDFKNHRVRKIDTDGTITTLVGTGQEAPPPEQQMAGAGALGTSIPIDMVAQMEIDGSNELYIAHRYTILVVDRDGWVRMSDRPAAEEAGAAITDELAGDLQGISFGPNGDKYITANGSLLGSGLQDLVYRVEAPPNCRRGPVADEWDTTNPTRASVYRLYCAYFLRFPDHSGYNYWHSEFATQRISLTGISDFFSASDEFEATYGSLSNADFLDLLYGNIMQRAADPGGRAYWLTVLDTGVLTKGGVVLQFSDSREFRNRTGTP